MIAVKPDDMERVMFVKSNDAPFFTETEHNVFI